MMNILLDLANRYDAYLTRGVDTEISAHDDMFVKDVAGGREHYFSVGRSAIDIVTQALFLTNKPTVRSILDLPCGGGRVTRHLQAMFPEAKLFVSDLNKDKEHFVVERFGARALPPDPEFKQRSSNSHFDLIFVGSLVTHFDEARFRNASSWFIDALAPDGILIMTAHGRRHDFMQCNGHNWIAPNLWQTAHDGFQKRGFGYVGYPGQEDYGLSVASPSWLLGLFESNLDARIVSFQEATWDHHQDAVVIQKRPITL